MELVKYGPIKMEIVGTHSALKRLVRDEADNASLWSEWRLDLDVHIGPDLTSLPNPNQSPGITVNYITSQLRKPRQRLQVIAGGATILDVPRDSMPCDARSGPFCELLNITQIVGTQYFLARVKFTAFDNECITSSSQNLRSKAVLSNVWTVQEEIDEFQYPVRTTEGLAIVSADAMRKLEITADEFRSQFFHPVPANHQRTQVNVVLSEDGTQLRYTIVDEGRCMNLGENSPFQDVNIWHESMATCGDTGSIIANMGGGAISGALSAIPKKRPSSRFRKSDIAAGIAVGGLSGMLSGLGDNLPSYTHEAVFEGWGRRSSDPPLMYRTAVGVVLNILRSGNDVGNIPINNPFHSNLFQRGRIIATVKHVLSERYIMFAMCIKLAGLAQAIPNFAGDVGANIERTYLEAGNVVQAATANLGFVGSVFTPVLSSNDLYINPPLADNNSRARDFDSSTISTNGNRKFQKFITQLLMNPCQQPPRPNLRDASGGFPLS